MPLISTANGDIWIEHEAPDLLPVMLIHGAGGVHTDWSFDLREWAFAVDLPGHGHSPGTSCAEVAAYAADIIALLDALEIAQVVVAGHSLGGAVAQTLALTHPERLFGVVLVSSGAKLAVHPDILNHIFDDPVSVADLLSRWLWSPRADVALIQAKYDQLLTVPPEVMFDDFSASNNFDVRDRLNEIRVPTLVVGGQQDVMTPPKFSQFLHTNIAGSDLVLIEQAGHMLPLEQSGALSDAITRWMASVL